MTPSAAPCRSPSPASACSISTGSTKPWAWPTSRRRWLLQFGGTVITGAGTLSLAGDITVAVNTVTTVPPIPATISGNLNLNGNTGLATPALRTITVAAAAAVPYDLLLTANVSGSESIRILGGGGLLLSGNNTYTGDTYLQAGTLALGSDTALGTGMLSWGSTLLAENGARTIANQISIDAAAVSFTGSDDLTFTGAANLTGARTITTPNMDTLTFANGLGDFLVQNNNFAKGGPGIVQFTAAATFGGTFAMSAAGGTVILGGAGGGLLNAASITVGFGDTLQLDNTTNNDTNRLRDEAAITLTGGSLVYYGAPGAASSETFGAITVNNAANENSEVSTTAGSARSRFWPAPHSPTPMPEPAARSTSSAKAPPWAPQSTR